MYIFTNATDHKVTKKAYSDSIARFSSTVKDAQFAAFLTKSLDWPAIYYKGKIDLVSQAVEVLLVADLKHIDVHHLRSASNMHIALLLTNTRDSALNATLVTNLGDNTKRKVVYFSSNAALLKCE